MYWFFAGLVVGAGLVWVYKDRLTRKVKMELDDLKKMVAVGLNTDKEQ